MKINSRRAIAARSEGGTPLARSRRNRGGATLPAALGLMLLAAVGMPRARRAEARPARKLAAAAGAAVQEANSAAGGQAAWAARQVRRALRAAGYRIGGTGPVVRLALEPGPAQSFRIFPHAGGVTIAAGDARGLIYGALQLCAELRAGRRLGQIRAEARSPQLAIRAFKYNLPLPGTLYLSHRNLRRHAWFWRRSYWRAFLDTLARDRFNALEFWSADPWPELVSVPGYPEASRLAPARLRAQVAFFHWLFHMAWERGLDVYLVTWNVDLPPSFARAHHLPERDVNTPVVRRYLRAAIRAVLREYPHLRGLGTTQGEQMGVITPDRRAAWIADVYFRAIQESGRRHVPFILRYWGGTPAATARAAAGYHDGPVYLDIKYNGEHAISSAQPHVANHAWLSQPHQYQILWHLRNDDIFTLRWGDPGLVRRMIRDLRRTGAAGFTFGSEADVPGRDDYDTPRFQRRQMEPYEFQKQWLMYALFGRLGYNAQASNQIWLRGFERRYGPAGPALARATEAAGRIAPEVTRFHWNYMNGDWMVEGGIGSWNTSAEQPRINYRVNGLYQGLRAWIFNNTLERGEETIPRYVAVAAGEEAPTGAAGPPATPLAVAARLEVEAHAALAAGRIAPPPAPYRAAFLAARSDALSWGELGLYYAAKIRGVAAAGTYLLTGEAGQRQMAIGDLQLAVRHWRRLAQITSGHYRPREIWQFGRFSWGEYTPDVRGDVTVARHLRPLAHVMQPWRVKPAVGGSWAPITLRLRGPLARNGLAAWLLDYDAWANAAGVRKAARGAAQLIWAGRAAAGAVLLVSGRQAAVARQAGAQLPAVPGFEPGEEAFVLPRAGAVTVQTAADQVPVLLPPPAVGRVRAQLSHAVPPAAVSAKGVALTAAIYRPPWDENIWRQAWGVGYGEYCFTLPAPGLYRVEVIASGSGSHLSLTVDDWNGPDKRLRRNGARWLSASPFALGAGRHSVEIFFDHPGLTVRSVAVTPGR